MARRPRHSLDVKTSEQYFRNAKLKEMHDYPGCMSVVFAEHVHAIALDGWVGGNFWVGSQMQATSAPPPRHIQYKYFRNTQATIRQPQNFIIKMISKLTHLP